MEDLFIRYYSTKTIVFAIVVLAVVVVPLLVGVIVFWPGIKRTLALASPRPVQLDTGFLDEPNEENLKFYGFLPEYRFDAADFDRFCEDGVSHIVLFSLEIDGETGELVGLEDRLPRGEIKERAERAHEKYGCKLAIALGGAGRSFGFINGTTDPARRARTVAGLAKLFRGWPVLSGVEINWQFPTSEVEMSSMVSLGKELKAALPSGTVISTAVAPDPTYVANLLHLEETVGFALDVYHVMMYIRGVGGPKTVENAEAVLIALRSKAGLSMAKSTLGLPFYGINTDTMATFTYEEILVRMRTGKREGAIFENVASMKRKVDLAKKLGMHGVSAWELGSDCRPRAVGDHPETCSRDLSLVTEIGKRARPKPKA